MRSALQHLFRFVGVALSSTQGVDDNPFLIEVVKHVQCRLPQVHLIMGHNRGHRLGQGIRYKRVPQTARSAFTWPLIGNFVSLKFSGSRGGVGWCVCVCESDARKT
jgi:hypothetical protein